jgi:hypothetical protein
MTQALLLGEAPSRHGDRYHAFPLSGRPAQVLCELADIAPDPDPRATRYGRWYWPLREAFDLENVLERYPGPASSGPGAAFPLAAAREALARLDLDAYPAVVCLGQRVAGVVGAPNAWHQWSPDRRLVTIPHPSGLNRLLNEPAQRNLCRLTLSLARAKAAAAEEARP